MLNQIKMSERKMQKIKQIERKGIWQKNNRREIKMKIQVRADRFI